MREQQQTMREAQPSNQNTLGKSLGITINHGRHKYVINNHNID